VSQAPVGEAPEGNWTGPGILCAVNRWLSKGDVRVEFYSLRASGELRVKIIDEDGIKTGDMSLANFVSSSPSTN
jgi:hypothetical protein